MVTRHQQHVQPEDKQSPLQLVVLVEGFMRMYLPRELTRTYADAPIRKHHLTCVSYNIEPTTVNMLHVACDLSHALQEAQDNYEIIMMLANHLDDTGGGLYDDTERDIVRKVCHRVHCDNYESRDVRNGLMAYTEDRTQALLYSGTKQVLIDVALGKVYDPTTRYYTFGSDDCKTAFEHMHLEMPSKKEELSVLPFIGSISFDEMDDVTDRFDRFASDGNIAFRVKNLDKMVGTIKTEDRTWHQNDDYNLVVRENPEALASGMRARPKVV